MYNNIPARSELAKKGFAMAEVQYRESELAIFPAQVTDVKKAIRFIHSIADRFHIDTDNIFIAGNSSGGHIALLTGLTAAHGEFDPDFAGGISCKVNGIISFSAPTDMFLSEGSGPTEDLLGTDNVNNARGLAKSASCKTYISAEREIPPVLMFHGEDDCVVSAEHSRSLYKILKRHDKEAHYYGIENAGHSSASFWGEDVLGIAERFIRKNCV